MEQLRLNLIPVGVSPVAHASQYDDGRTIRFNLYDGDSAYTLSGAEVITLKVIGENGTLVETTLTNTSSTYVEWTVAESDLTECGTFIGEIKIDDIGSLNFTLSVEEDAYNGKTIEIRTASGTIATFTTNLADFLNSVKCEINPVQSGSGTPSPSNPRTINGHTACVVSKCGVNLIKKQSLMQYCPMASGTRLYAQLFDTAASFSLYIVKKGLDPTITANWTSFLSLSTTKVNNTLPFDISHIGISNSAYSSLGTGNIMVSLSDITEFEAYNGSSETISFGQTVYGGSLDVTSGVLTITHYYLKGGFTQYASSGGYKAYRINDLPKSKAQSQGGISNMIGTFGSFSSASMTENIISLPISNILYMALDENANPDDVEVCYELATPTTVQLTAKQIEQLVGQNNLYHDCNGDIEVKYLIEV